MADTLEKKKSTRSFKAIDTDPPPFTRIDRIIEFFGRKRVIQQKSFKAEAGKRKK